MKSKKFKKQKRWIIFGVMEKDSKIYEGIIAILSARKSLKYVQDFLEDLSRILPVCSEDILDFTKFTNPRIPYPAKRESDENGRFVSITCGYNPYLEARLVEILGFESNGADISWMPTHSRFGKKEKRVSKILSLGINVIDDQTKQITK